MEEYESLAGPERRVVSYDQRGAGRSSVPGDLDYSLDAQVADETVSVHAAELTTFDSPTLLVAGDNDVFGPDWLERHRELLGLARYLSR